MTSGAFEWCIKGLLPPQQETTLSKLCNVIKRITSPQLFIADLPSLQADTHEALALFERDFPLSMQVNYTCTYIDFPCLHTWIKIQIKLVLILNLRFQDVICKFYHTLILCTCKSFFKKDWQPICFSLFKHFTQLNSLIQVRVGNWFWLHELQCVLQHSHKYFHYCGKILFNKIYIKPSIHSFFDYLNQVVCEFP